MIDPIHDKLCTLLEQGVVLIPDPDLAGCVAGALDWAEIEFSQACYDHSRPTTYVIRISKENRANEERLRKLLCAPDVPLREPNRRIPSEAAAFEAIRTRSRAAAQATATNPRVQQTPLALAPAAIFGAVVGGLAALVCLYTDNLPRLIGDSFTGFLIFLCFCVAAGAIGAMLGEVIERICERAYAHLQTRRSRPPDVH